MEVAAIRRQEVGRLSSSPSPDAAGLVARAQAGDTQAFGALYELFAALVHGVLLARVGPRAAPDLVQDVFLSALKGLRSLQEPATIGPWLAAIARNRALDWLRSGRREETADAFDPPDTRSQAGLDDEEESRRALDAILELPDAYRETLVLRLVEGLSGPEIAERCGMTSGSVRVNLCRGMRLLRGRLGLPAEREEQAGGLR